MFQSDSVLGNYGLQFVVDILSNASAHPVVVLVQLGEARVFAFGDVIGGVQLLLKRHREHVYRYSMLQDGHRVNPSYRMESLSLK